MSASQSVSALTIIRGRQDHFDHLVAGLGAQVQPPDELIVAFMQEDAPAITREVPFPVHFVHVPGGPLPLASARNQAAERASGNILAFLDVDCIPDREYVRCVNAAVETEPDGIFLPEVRYLPASDNGWMDHRSGEPDYPRLTRNAVRHPAKPEVYDRSIIAIDDYGELWGLAFALRRETWRKAGGMDENYIGYGAEETDFGQRLKSVEAPMFWLGGTLCFHQHHSVHKPPLQHFTSIIRNARLYRARWGEWCMTYWLDDFEKRGLIARRHDTIEVIRTPTPAEIEQTEQGPDVRFS